MSESGSHQTLERLLWAILGLVILGLIALGVLQHRQRVPESVLPVIAKAPAFELQRQDGTVLRSAELRGNPWVADFIFTRCVAICPRMTAQMQKVVESLGQGSSVQFVSISVDPEHDTPEVLQTYADRYGAGDNWHFLTGGKETIEVLTREGFLLALDTDPGEAEAVANNPIIHSNRFVLVDGEGRIRSYYNAFDEAEIQRLMDDIARLS